MKHKQIREMLWQHFEPRSNGYYGSLVKRDLRNKIQVKLWNLLFGQLERSIREEN